MASLRSKPGVQACMRLVQMTLVLAFTPASALHAQGVARQLVCRGKAGIDLSVEADPSAASARQVTMLLRFKRSDRKVGDDYGQLEEGTCTWNPYGYDGVPKESGEVHFDVEREGQPWSATGTRQLDTTSYAGAFFPDPVSLPRFLAKSDAYYVFYVDDATNRSGSFGPLAGLVVAPTFVTITGPWPPASGAPGAGPTLGDARHAADQMNSGALPAPAGREGQSTERTHIGASAPGAGQRPTGNQGATTDVPGVAERQIPTIPLGPDPSRSIPTVPHLPPNPIRSAPAPDTMRTGQRRAAPGRSTLIIGNVRVTPEAEQVTISFVVTGGVQGAPEVVVTSVSRRGTGGTPESVSRNIVMTVEAGPNGTWIARAPEALSAGTTHDYTITVQGAESRKQRRGSFKTVTGNR